MDIRRTSTIVIHTDAVEKNGQCTLPPVPPEKETELQQSPAELPSGAEKLCSGARLHTVRLSA